MNYTIVPNGDLLMPSLPNPNFQLLAEHAELLVAPLLILAAFTVVFASIWRNTRAPHEPQPATPKVQQEYVYSIVDADGKVLRTVRAFDVDLQPFPPEDSPHGRRFFNFFGPNLNDGGSAATVAWIDYRDGLSILSDPVQPQDAGGK